MELKMAKHKFIDWKLAEKLAYIQCTRAEIAATLSIDEDTLQAACKRENRLSFSVWYKKHSENGKCSLRRSMWKMATNEKPNPTMAIWLSKNYLGMTDFLEQNMNIKETPKIQFVIGRRKDKDK